MDRTEVRDGVPPRGEVVSSQPSPGRGGGGTPDPAAWGCPGVLHLRCNKYCVRLGAGGGGFAPVGPDRVLTDPCVQLSLLWWWGGGVHSHPDAWCLQGDMIPRLRLEEARLEQGDETVLVHFLVHVNAVLEPRKMPSIPPQVCWNRLLIIFLAIWQDEH